MRVLVLGGTGEAHRLCLKLHEAGFDFVHSMAGVLEKRANPPYPLRIGGFGGRDGLSEFLTQGGFTHLVIATHPFALKIAAHAIEAANLLDLPLIAYQRPDWQKPPGADWRPFDAPD
ncbi:MAG: precorrin-6A/cobalt-precorrin-6A reductase, partial [Rhodospirillales bacterium]|nr:precorrin-6A/cobalt-precorrin-6A reductase [Rhodospirillales bacterium]